MIATSTIVDNTINTIFYTFIILRYFLMNKCFLDFKAEEIIWLSVHRKENQFFQTIVVHPGSAYFQFQPTRT